MIDHEEISLYDRSMSVKACEKTTVELDVDMLVIELYFKDSVSNDGHLANS